MDKSSTVKAAQNFGNQKKSFDCANWGLTTFLINQNIYHKTII